MALFFDFAVIRLAPGDARDERLNIGAIVFRPDGLDIRLTRRLEKVRAISAALDPQALLDLINQFSTVDLYARESGCQDASSRHRMLARVGPLSLSGLGVLDATPELYEDRLGAILRDLVEPEPQPKHIREKRSRLLTQVKKAFFRERVLARKGETLEDHRILPGYEVGEGLVADLVLKNGVYHVVETVDASRDEDSIRRVIGEIGMSALTLDGARLRFGEAQTKGRLVYHASAYTERHAKAALDVAVNQGCELINWASDNDRGSFVSSLALLATPLPTGRRMKQKASMAVPLI